MREIRSQRRVWLRTSQGYPEWVGEVELEGFDVYMVDRYPSRFKWVARVRSKVACLKPLAAFKLWSESHAQ